MNEKPAHKAKDFLTHLNNYPEIKDYKHLGYTLKSILSILQTAILTEIEYPELVDHTQWDIYNLLNLTKSLISESEFEFLDRLNTK